MKEWYYAKGGQQIGPVGLEDLRALIASGELNPASDLVWKPTMADWLPAAQVPEFSGNPPAENIPGGAYVQPFAYATASGPIHEIVPGSEPIVATACVKRAWDLVVKNLGPWIVVAVIFLVVTFGVGFVVAMVGSLLGLTTSGGVSTSGPSYSGVQPSSGGGAILGTALFQIVSNLITGLVSAFLMLGVTRMGLNAVSGRPISVGMLFGQGDLLLKAFGARILYFLMVAVGLLLFIFPGIYLALKYGQYLNGIVDKRLGVMDSFSYSAKLTQNNMMSLFVIGLLSFCLAVAGCIALGVGLLFAYPVIWLSWIVAYRWMQYGGRAIMDDPVSKQPILANSPD